MQAGAALFDNEQNYAPEADSQAASISLRYEFLKAATARQTISQDLGVIMDMAAKSIPEMTRSAEDFAARVGGTLGAVGVKSHGSAAPKVTNEYKGDAGLLCDPVRATVIIPADNVDLCRAALALHESTCAVKDLLAKPSKTGLAILNAKVTLGNGLKGEIQFVTPHMHQAMQHTHNSYKKIDELTTAFAEKALPVKIASEIKRLETDCVDYHATAAYLDDLDRFVDKKTAKAHPSPA